MSTPGGGSEIRVVTRVARGGGIGRAGRRLARLVGALLVVAGVVLAVPALLLLVLLPAATVWGDGATAREWLLLPAFAIAAWIPLWLGLRLVRGRRRLVLFLRRFGFNEASEALTFAVSTAMGSRWRLATLDDSEIAPVGVDRRTRAFWGGGRWIALIALAAGVAWAVSWWTGGGPAEQLDGLFDAIRESQEESGANPFEAIVGTLIVGLVLGVVVLTLMLTLIAAALATLGVAAIGFWQTSGAVRRAERSRALSVATDAEAEAAADRVGDRARGIHAARLVVLRVHDRAWRAAVRALAEEAAIAIVDVSVPSEHLAWEVRTLQGEVRARLVLIGRRDLVEALARGDDGGAAARELRELLGGQVVLAYEADAGDAEMRRFARSLTALLEGGRPA